MKQAEEQIKKLGGKLTEKETGTQPQLLPDAARVKLRWFEGGHCLHPEWVTLRGGKRQAVRIPAGFACIEHPQRGIILVDTGYASSFLRETERYPNKLYRAITPVVFHEEESAMRRLAAVGIRAGDVRDIIITHFHGDHIAGLREFPAAEFHYAARAYASVRDLGKWSALRRAFLPGLLPDDFDERSVPFDSERLVPLAKPFPWRQAFDLLGDGSLLAVDLPGHADGQIGLLLSTERHSYLLCADAAWSSLAIRENRPPHPLAGLIMPDRRAYRSSFDALVGLHRSCPELRIVPSHCPEITGAWFGGEGEEL